MPDAATPAPPRFVAVGHHGLRLASEDGAAWKEIQVGKEGETYRAVAHGNGRFVAVGSYGGNNIFAASPDGFTWQTVPKDAGIPPTSARWGSPAASSWRWGATRGPSATRSRSG